MTNNDPNGGSPTYGDVNGPSTASFASNNCTGYVLVNSVSFQPGQIFKAGTPGNLYYIPKTGFTQENNPARNSRNTTTLTCESPTTALFNGTYYRGLPLDAAAKVTTGFNLNLNSNGVITTDFAP